MGLRQVLGFNASDDVDDEVRNQDHLWADGIDNDLHNTSFLATWFSV